ncbi:MAG: SBBP repeat-containing protein [Candidatus Hermodarchaeota archaeon]
MQAQRRWDIIGIFYVLRGSGGDSGYSLAVDSAGNAYVTGGTYDDTTDFPTTPGAINETHNGDQDVFVCKISADGTSLMYSTFLGEAGNDRGYALTIDSATNIYVTGSTTSTDFPTTAGAIDETHNGVEDVVVCKISADGTSLVYSTFLGGSSSEIGEFLALDSAENIYVVGGTYNHTTNFPTTAGAINETHNGVRDVFVCKLSADGTSLVYSTFLGGSNYDFAGSLAVDSVGNAYVTGGTTDDVTDFPTTAGAINETHNGEYDVFVCKISADGTSLIWSTLLGGSGSESGSSLALDSANNVYVTGDTEDHTTDFPTTSGAINETHNGGENDAFVCKLNTDGTALLYSTFLGGSQDSDRGRDIAFDSSDNVYITGYTYSTDFPTTPGAIDKTHNGDQDVFVCKISFNPPTIGLASLVNESVHQSGTTIDLIITDDGSISHVLYNWDGAANVPLSAPYDLTLPSGEGQHTLYVYANDTEGFGASKTFVFTTDDTGPTITLTSPTNGTTGAAGTTIDLSITDLNGLSHVWYSWDGAANATLASPYDLTLPASTGQHILRVYANDTAGNWASQTYVFTTETPTSTTSTTTPTPGLELLTFLATIGLLVLFERKKRHAKTNKK